MNGENVRMIERGSGVRFLLESPQTIFVVREFVRQELERDFAFEFRIQR